MQLLVDIAPALEPILPTMSGGEVYDRFQREPDTLAIAVIDETGRPVGLVERNAFLVSMAAQYGHALWAKRPVSYVMNTNPLIAGAEVTVAEFCGRILQERPSDLLHGFIVTRGGKYAGVGTALALLQASAEATTTHATELTRLAQEANAALAAKGRFLAVMSHEIRTPLNGVLAVAEILKRKSLQPDLDPFIETILESGGTLLRLLNDALDLSRAEAAGLELDEQPLAISDLLDGASGLWRAQADLKGLELTATYDGPPDLWVMADAVRLRQVLNNLVGNALKFTADGGIQVRLTALRQGDQVRLNGVVSDSGPGIPEDLREAIFAPFQQTDEGARRGGVGLGLAVCSQIAERMGGVVTAGVSPQGGAEFRFEMPLRWVSESPNFAERAPAVETSGRSVHVLIADDNATNRTVAETLCEMFGCTSESVGDGREAVAAAATGRFDLILMDIKMPVMDGIEATRLIRSRADFVSTLPILALTANADPADAAFYRASGMNGVVEKPIKPERLLAAMDAVMQLEPDALVAVA